MITCLGSLGGVKFSLCTTREEDEYLDKRGSFGILPGDLELMLHRAMKVRKDEIKYSQRANFALHWDCENHCPGGDE